MDVSGAADHGVEAVEGNVSGNLPARRGGRAHSIGMRLRARPDIVRGSNDGGRREAVERAAKR